MNELNIELFSDSEFEADDISVDETIEETEENPDTSTEGNSDDKKKETEDPIEETNTPESVDEEDQDESITPDVEDKSLTPNAYSSLANILHNEGVLPSLDPESSKIESAEDFIQAVRNEIKTNEFSSLNDRQKRYLDALEKGIPEETFAKREQQAAMMNDITDEAIEDEENEDLRKDLITSYFRLKGFSPEEAEEFAQQNIDSGKDIDLAKRSKVAIAELQAKEYQKIQEQAEQAKQAEAQLVEDFKKTVKDSKGLIDGLKMTEKAKSDIINSVTKAVEFTPDGRPLTSIAKYQKENPIDFQFKLAYLFNVTNGFENFDKFTTVKKAKSKASKELDELLLDNGSFKANDMNAITTGKKGVRSSIEDISNFDF